MSNLQDSRRFRAIEVPMALPGCCYFCRNHEGPFIDTGISEDMFGVVYICKTCISEMAIEFGYISPEGYTELQKNATIYQDQKAQALAQLETIREENNAIRRTIAAISSSSSDSLDGVDNTADDGSRDEVNGKSTKQDANISPGTVKGRVKSSSNK